MAQQTAVDWIIEQLPIRIKNYLQRDIEIAKQVEKDQIIDSWESSRISMMNGEQYYNETYKK